MDHPESAPPVADDLSFLEDLDRGLDVQVPAEHASSFAAPPRRPRLDLFQPTPAENLAAGASSRPPPDTARVALTDEQSARLIDVAMVEAAGRDVGLTQPEAPSAKMIRLGLGAAVFVVLTLMGAGAATLVFRAQIRRAVAQWQALPPLPPPPAVTVVRPIEPAPEPTDPRVKP